MIPDILFNSFSANLFFVMASVQILYALVAFGKSPYVAPFAASVAGGATAQFLHYLFGAYLNLLRRKQKIMSDEIYHRIGHYIRRYGIWLLLVFVFPLYAIIPILAGFFRARLWQCMLLIVCAQISEKLYAIQAIEQAMR